jgi:hypothetical protein
LTVEQTPQRILTFFVIRIACIEAASTGSTAIGSDS